MFALFSRIRGYHSDRLKLPGFATGVIESYYYALPENKLKMKEYWPVSLVAPFFLFHVASFLSLTLQFISNIRCQEFSTPASFLLVGVILTRESRNLAHEKATARKVVSNSLLRGCFDAGIYQSPACGKLTCVELHLHRIEFLHMVEVIFERVIPTRNNSLLKPWALFFISVITS
jgi:hypothetical protein